MKQWSREESEKLQDLEDLGFKLRISRIKGLIKLPDGIDPEDGHAAFSIGYERGVYLSTKFREN